MISSKIGPIPAEHFDGEVEFNPDAEGAYGPASRERMDALRRRLLRRERAFSILQTNHLRAEGVKSRWDDARCRRGI